MQPSEPKWNKVFRDTADRRKARQHWRDVCAEMEAAGILSAENGHAIERLAVLRIEYRKAQTKVDEQGAIIETEGQAPKRNPWFLVLRQISGDITRIETELCISPARRGRAKQVTNGKPHGTGAPADGYLAGVPS